MDEKTIQLEEVRSALVEVANELDRNREHYNDLDGPIGDSDHGDSICGAFGEVKEVVLDQEKEDIGDLLKSVGFSITSTAGGAMGPLYGSAFMEAGKKVAGQEKMTFEDFVEMWKAFAAGIQNRGDVEQGDKTMYDTIKPAVDELESAFSSGKSLKKSFQLMIEAAEEGKESTANMKAKKGRASRLQDRTEGHIDPGAASMFTIIATFNQSLSN